MKYAYMALIVAFMAIVLLFKFQSLDSVTVSLFSASLTLPLSVFVIAIYVLGMLTGGFIVSARVLDPRRARLRLTPDGRANRAPPK